MEVIIFLIVGVVVGVLLAISARENSGVRGLEERRLLKGVNRALSVRAEPLLPSVINQDNQERKQKHRNELVKK